MKSHRICAAVLVLTAAGRAFAQVPLELELVTDQIASPVVLTHRAGDLDNIFVGGLKGRVTRIQNGVLDPTPYLDVSGKIGSFFEHGLLGLAFHPDYPAVKQVFAAYSDAAGSTVVSRWLEDPADPTRVLPGSETVILGPVVQPGLDHNGGCLAFGPDGLLYIGMGDGGSPNDSGPGHLPGGNAQSLTTLLGKILRLDVDLPFPHVPPTNPFVGVSGARPEIWAYGLRNPWRFSFDHQTGELFIGDVGENTREEISILPPGVGGLNLGWRCMEGTLCTGLSGCSCTDATLVDPVHIYNHVSGLCSVTGGVRYRGCAIPSLDGLYFFGDFCSGTIWTFEWDGQFVSNLVNRKNELFPLPPGSQFPLASFGEDALGEVYVCAFGIDQVWKLVPEAGVPDCDLDGIADGCAIALGLDTDLDGDGVPDSCQCAVPPILYCTAKTDSKGCPVQLSAQGAPSVSAPGPFWIRAQSVINQQAGTLFFGGTPAAAPFAGGTLCVGPPSRRAGIQFSNGNPPPLKDCSGLLEIDFNAYVQASGSPFLVAGTRIYAQYFYRDPGDPFGLALTQAVEFELCP